MVSGDGLGSFNRSPRSSYGLAEEVAPCQEASVTSSRPDICPEPSGFPTVSLPRVLTLYQAVLRDGPRVHAHYHPALALGISCRAWDSCRWLPKRTNPTFSLFLKKPSILDTNDRLAIHTHGRGPYKLQSGKYFSRLENTSKQKISHILPSKTGAWLLSPQNVRMQASSWMTHSPLFNVSLLLLVPIQRLRAPCYSAKEECSGLTLRG